MVATLYHYKTSPMQLIGVDSDRHTTQVSLSVAQPVTEHEPL